MPRVPCFFYYSRRVMLVASHPEARRPVAFKLGRPAPGPVATPLLKETVCPTANIVSIANHIIFCPYVCLICYIGLDPMILRFRLQFYVCEFYLYMVCACLSYTHMCACRLYLYIYICIYIYIYIYLFICTYVSIHAESIYTHMCICIYIYMW